MLSVAPRPAGAIEEAEPAAVTSVRRELVRRGDGEDTSFDAKVYESLKKAGAKKGIAF